MPVSFDNIEKGQLYTRPALAELWGYAKYNAIARGVVTPANTTYIILFVTKIKQESLTQYHDYKDRGFLVWEGEANHGNDRRILHSQKSGDEIHLFYREVHHSPFVYEGIVEIAQAFIYEDRPSVFRFSLQSKIETSLEPEVITVGEAATSYRIGQDKFRIDQIRNWGECAVTGCRDLRLLRAAHIKPWSKSDSDERLDPDNGLLLSPSYDVLFECGMVSFTNSGSIILADSFSLGDRRALGVTGKELLSRQLPPEASQYLEYHRDVRFDTAATSLDTIERKIRPQ